MVRRRNLIFWFAAGAILVAALGLRIACAQGDLWQDEITSLKLAAAAHSALGVFLLSYDNNHLLNTLYLYLIGPNASPLAWRALSIALGVAAVAAVGAVFAKEGRGAMLSAMALFAACFVMVNYGSEARGYAGLILCTILAVHFLDVALQTGRYRRRLALALCSGMLFHFSMAGAIGALVIAALIDRWQQTGRIKNAVQDTIAIFLPTLYGFVPIAFVIAAAMHHSGGYHFGALTQFTVSGLVAGYGGMIDAVLALPETLSPYYAMAIALLVATLCYHWRRPDNKRPLIYLALIVALPIAVLVFHVPNSGIRRYYLCSATAFLLAACELAIMAWQRGKTSRKIATILVLAFIAAQLYDLARFLPLGRGHYGTIVALMTKDGAAFYGGDDQDAAARIELDFYAKRQAASLSYIPEKDACSTAPQFLVIEVPLKNPPQPATRFWGNAPCQHQFGDPRAFSGWGISGARLTLYRRLD